MARTLNVIDSDGHVLEPPNLWVDYIDPAFRGREPVLKQLDDGTERMFVDGAPAGRKGAKLGFLGSIGARDGSIAPKLRYGDGTPGGFDPKARLEDMDADGIDGAFLYPSLGLYLAGIADLELAAASARAYNRWLADYCSAAPDRLFGVALLPFQSPEAAAEEIAFAAKELGFRGGFMRPNPYDGRAVHHPDNDVVWKAAQDHDFGIGFHEGQSSGQPTLGDERFIDSIGARHCVSHMMEMQAAAVSVLMMGIADRFPELRFAFLEASGGWMAGVLDRMDRHYNDQASNDMGLSAPPSELFHRQGFIAFEPVERTLPMVIDFLGADNILWATDYPHVDGYIGAPEMVRKMGLSDDQLTKVLAGGAKRYYGLS